MKQIKDYIVEKYLIDKDTDIIETVDDLFNNIDLNYFKWNSLYSLDDYQEKCKKEVKELSNKLYKSLNSCDKLKQLYEDSYLYYLKTENSAKTFISKLYSEKMRQLHRIGWSQFEEYSIEQGWLAFMYWIKKKNNL